MSISDKLLDFVKYANFSNDNISYLKSELGRTNKQLIRDSFELLRNTLKLYKKNSNMSLIIYNTINFIIVLCYKEIFTSEQIEINKKRIKKIRNLLYPYVNDNELNLKSIDLLDEIILDKSINTLQLTKLIKELIDRLEDIDIIKKFINLNKAVISESTELFDYVFNKTIDALKDDNRDAYYYITLLKIMYNTKVNKNNYLNQLHQFEKDIITDEINHILDGDKRPYDGDRILDKYGIITNPSIMLIPNQSIISSKEPIITIDSKNASLKDDAISVKKDGNKYIVSIYITNPTEIIKMGSHVDKDACNNFKSMYLPRNRVHMFNKKIESHISLDKNKCKNVFALEVVINDSGELIDYYLKKYTIIVSDNLTYSYVDSILNNSRKNDDLYFINTLNSLAKAIRNNNNKKTEYWKLKDNANNVSERSESECLISEFMILYNRLIAEIAKKEKIPYVYRGKEKEYISDLMLDLGIDIDNKTQKILSSLFLESEYSKEPTFHYGLGFDCYSHSTDPGRRYVDLYNQYLMNMYYFGKYNKDNFDYEKFDMLIEYFNKRARELSLMHAEYIRSLSLKK